MKGYRDERPSGLFVRRTAHAVRPISRRIVVDPSDDLAALPIRRLLERLPALDPSLIDEVILGCANQAGEDNRNVARMAALLAGLPVTVPACTVNRLCASGRQRGPLLWARRN